MTLNHGDLSQPEYSRKCKKHRKYIGTIHTVQNTNVLSYCSIILPLRFPISFTLHNTHIIKSKVEPITTRIKTLLEILSLY